MATIREMLQQQADYLRRSLALTNALIGEAPAEEPVPPSPPMPAASKFVNGMSAPDALGRVELELVERLVSEFGEAPNGYRIPRLWFVDFAPISHLPQKVREDHAMNVAGAGFNFGIPYTYKDEKGWFGKPARVKDQGIPGSLAWNGSLADLEAALRAQIANLLNPNQTPPYKHEPNTGVLDTVAGYIGLKKPIA